MKKSTSPVGRDFYPVSRVAILARVNRRLAADGEMVRRTRSQRARQDLGEWFRVETSRNLLLEKDVDIEDLARELGTLKSYEKLVED